MKYLGNLKGTELSIGTLNCSFKFLPKISFIMVYATLVHGCSLVSKKSVDKYSNGKGK